MSIYIDMYGREFVKDGNKFFNTETRQHERIYSLLVPIWGSADNWHTIKTIYVRPSYTSCPDEETPKSIEAHYITRDAAKAAAVEECERHFRTLAILGGY